MFLQRLMLDSHAAVGEPFYLVVGQHDSFLASLTSLLGRVGKDGKTLDLSTNVGVVLQ